MNTRIPLAFVLGTAALLSACAAVEPPGARDDPGAASAPAGSVGFVTDAVTLPMSRVEFGDDLLGDGWVRNQFGFIEATLADNGADGSAMAAAMLLDCSLVPTAEVSPPPPAGNGDGAGSDDASGTSAAVAFRSGSADAAATVSGVFRGGRYVSTRVRAQETPVTLGVHLPVFSHSDPITVVLEGVEIELRADGQGGYAGQLHGAVPPTFDLHPLVHRALLQMLAGEPDKHADLLHQIDSDHDGAISFAEFEASPIVQSMLSPDVQLFDRAGRWAPGPTNLAPDSISVGLGFHLVPAATAQRRCDAPDAGSPR